MDKKSAKEIGFLLKEKSKNKLVVKGVIKQKVSNRRRKKRDCDFSEVTLHLFDDECLNKLREIEVKIVSEYGNKNVSLKNFIIGFIVTVGKLLMK